MRCHYMSDLHLESQDFGQALPKGDVLIVAGDLCHAACLDPARADLYARRQRERVLRFADAARSNFAHVLVIAGNHDHYDGVFEDTIATLRRELTGFTILDDEAIEIGGVRFFGTTLWSDFERGSEASLNKARKGAGEFFFVRTRSGEPVAGILPKLRPEDALRAHAKALAALQAAASDSRSPMVVISHHAPSLKGLNPLHVGNGLDGAYASNLDDMIAGLQGVPVWVHGHTHIRRAYRIGATRVLSNCRGFDGRDSVARTFSPDVWFEV